jgi:hypothetical protein
MNNQARRASNMAKLTRLQDQLIELKAEEDAQMVKIQAIKAMQQADSAAPYSSTQQDPLDTSHPKPPS